ncbi:hypothetical protein D3C85_1853210 [compost metagenome]
MAQSRMQSLIETSSNTLIGVIGSWLITMGCFLVFTTPIEITTASTIACTVWSLLRGYYVRRYFSSKEN